MLILLNNEGTAWEARADFMSAIIMLFSSFFYTIVLLLFIITNKGQSRKDYLIFLGINLLPPLIFFIRYILI